MIVKKATKFDKVVRREICRITTKGTRTFGIIDGETNDAENSFLIALSEKVYKFLNFLLNLQNINYYLLPGNKQFYFIIWSMLH